MPLPERFPVKLYRSLVKLSRTHRQLRPRVYRVENAGGGLGQENTERIEGMVD